MLSSKNRNFIKNLPTNNVRNDLVDYGSGVIESDSDLSSAECTRGIGGRIPEMEFSQSQFWSISDPRFLSSLCISRCHCYHSEILDDISELFISKISDLCITLLGGSVSRPPSSLHLLLYARVMSN